MANQVAGYGLSAECAAKSRDKYLPARARACLLWIQQVTGAKLDLRCAEEQEDFTGCLKDGTLLCKLINVIAPNSVKKINTMNAPFKHRENIEMFLKATSAYGLKAGDLFQVNDLYEGRNAYLVVAALHGLGGLAQQKGWAGPALGAKVSSENRRQFDDEVVRAGKTVISLQYGTNEGASQAGMSMGSNRPIKAEEFVKDGAALRSQQGAAVSLQYGTNQGASQAGMSPYGAARPIRPEELARGGRL
jgi:hypothetical protein